MPSLLPTILTASHFVLAADQVPKFEVDGGFITRVAVSTEIVPV